MRCRRYERSLYNRFVGITASMTAMLRATNFAFARGAVIIASAGNNAFDLDNLDPFVFLPAELPNVIAVTGTTNPDFPPDPACQGIDCLAFYSNFGTSLHGLAAPGGDLPARPPPGPTGFVRGACSPGHPAKPPASPTTMPPDGSFGCFSFPGPLQHAWYVQAIGTSASAPHVAGVAALIIALNPSLTASQVVAILRQTAEDIGKIGYDEQFNFGLVNAIGAVGATP